MSESVNQLIERVMVNHPRIGPKAQAAYFEDVHQELAPLARELEMKVLALKKQNAELLAALADINESVLATGKSTQFYYEIRHKCESAIKAAQHSSHQHKR